MKSKSPSGSCSSISYILDDTALEALNTLYPAKWESFTLSRSGHFFYMHIKTYEIVEISKHHSFSGTFEGILNLLEKRGFGCLRKIIEELECFEGETIYIENYP